MEEPTFLPILYELDAREEWTDPTKWQKANPGLGTIKKYKTLADFVQRAKNSPDDLPGVLCKDFNIREVSAAVWLSSTPSRAISVLSSRTSITPTPSAGATSRPRPTSPRQRSSYASRETRLSMFCNNISSRKARLHTSRRRTPTRPHIENGPTRGLLTICPGNRVNYSDVTAWFCQMRDEYKIDCIKVGYDRALAGYWVDEMKSNGFDMEAVAQGPYTWSQPMREMGAALEGKQVNYNGNPMLVWCLTNTGVKKSGLNNIQPVKITEKRRIDGMVSLLNAWTIYVKYYEDFMYNVG